MSEEAAKNHPVEGVQRLEPARLEEVPNAISDVVAELAAASAKLGHGLNPRTAVHLAGAVRLMNTYYSNLIEGHVARPMDIERALAHLSPTARAVIWLFEGEGYSHEEIASAFGRTVSFSKSQLSRAHVRLRAWFEPQGDRPSCTLI